MPEQTEPPSQKVSRGWKIVGSIVASMAVILAVVVAVAWFSRHEISPEECLRLERLKNLAVGILENSKDKKYQDRLPQADAAFVEIAENMPRDPLGHRNLAIARLAAVEEKKIDAALAVEAANNLLDVEGGSPDAHLLVAKLAHAIGSDEQALAEIKRATQLAPDDPTAWYSLFAATEFARDAALKAEGLQALGRARQLRPENLFLLAVSVRAQAAAHDKQLVETLQIARQRVKFIVEGGGRQLQQELIEFSGAALRAAEQEEWNTVWVSANRFANKLLSPATQPDQRRIDKDPLEYVLDEFGPRYCPKSHESDAVSEPSISVELTALTGDAQFPQLSDVVDLELADFDLDDRLDVIVLTRSGVEVYGRGATAGIWRKMCQFETGDGFSRLVVADLDQDDPRYPTARERRARERKERIGEQQPAEVGDQAEEQTELTPDRQAKPAEIAVMNGGQSACAVADVDVLVFGSAGLLVLRNGYDEQSESRTLEAVAQSPEMESLSEVLAVAVADVYHDGDLDLVVSTAQGLSLWSNRGDMTFYDISSWSKLPSGKLRATALVPVDLERDVDLDVIAAGAGPEPGGYLENMRHGQMRFQPLDGFEALASASALALLDADANRSWDLAVAGEHGLAVALTKTSLAGEITNRASKSLSSAPRSGVATWDYDNDGYLDLIAWSEASLDFFRGGPAGEFKAVPRLLPGTRQKLQTCKVGDLDGDGDQDLALLESGRVTLYSNEGGNRNHWLNVRLLAGIADQQTLSFRVNHYGVGSLIEIRTGPIYQAKVVTGQVTHFGLGKRTHPDVARIVWTTGVPQNLIEPQRDQTICEEQVLLGSCPYLYTWTGEKYEFYTDCLWSAPLGLQLAEGVFAPSRAWEYLRISGDKLKTKDGVYRLQITEELWEAAYLDQVQLIAVDHPADVEVFSNEKVGPAEIAEFKVHTVRRPRVPLAARDRYGRDVLEQVRRRDGEYLKAFDHKLGPGLVAEHWLELDLGPLDHPRQMTLFLTGWVFPTGTSMNVGVSQNPHFDGPRPPSLWVPDASGQWRQVRPYIGFPGGKTKTIAIDLSDAFLTSDYRVRIATSMEIYWDEVFYTLDEEPAPTQLTPLDLKSADLHYRGFSRRIENPGYGPEDYDYDDVSMAPKWPPMLGRFTRYGPVDELLTETDDLQVVLGAGDELTLEFTAPDDPPAGWQRDFLLYNVGWDKDADLNTAFGQVVEPLPFGAMSAYPYRSDETYPDSPRHQEYLRSYQTRVQNPLEFWSHISESDISAPAATDSSNVQ